MTVNQLKHELSVPELNNWLAYFEDNPAEWEMSERIEIMLARFASGFFKGTPEDHMLLSAKRREETNQQDFIDAIQNLGLPANSNADKE